MLPYVIWNDLEQRLGTARIELGPPWLAWEMILVRFWDNWWWNCSCSDTKLSLTYVKWQFWLNMVLRKRLQTTGSWRQGHEIYREGVKLFKTTELLCMAQSYSMHTTAQGYASGMNAMHIISVTFYEPWSYTYLEFPTAQNGGDSGETARCCCWLTWQQLAFSPESPSFRPQKNAGLVFVNQK